MLRVVFVICSAFVSMMPAAGVSAPVPPGEPPVPAAPLTLAVARERALAASPAIQAIAAQAAAAEGAYRQSRAFANPSLGVEVEDFGGTLPAEAGQRTISLTQGIEWFGKRSARVQAAALALDVAARDLERARRDLLAEVDRGFSALLGAQERLAIAEENGATAREVTDAVSALVAAGEVSPVELSRAEGDAALAEIDRSSAAQDVELARHALGRLWGDADPPPERAVGEFATEAKIPDRAELLGRLAELPDLRRWDAELERQESLHTLAQRQALPDLEVSVGSRTYGAKGAHGYVAGLALPIPLLTQYAGARAEAAALAEQARLARRAEETALRAAALSACATLTRALDEVRVLRDTVLPRAASVYEALSEGYRRGKFPLLDLLEARRALAAARLRFVDARERLAVAAADLRRFAPAGEVVSEGGQR
jgi:outer membrane protein, heavy metal efflux system